MKHFKTLFLFLPLLGLVSTSLYGCGKQGEDSSSSITTSQTSEETSSSSIELEISLQILDGDIIGLDVGDTYQLNVSVVNSEFTPTFYLIK